MDKIYSRKRIKIPNLKKQENKILRKTIKTGIILIIAVFISITVYNSSKPIFEKLCLDRAKNLATQISNQQATKVMEDYEYDQLVTIHKDSQDKINLIETNIIEINKITSDVALKIQEEINKTEDDDIGIHLGSFTGSKILSGRGPKIPIKITSIGNVETDFKSEFKEAGINQTLHRLYLDVQCQISILTPFNNIEETIKNQIVLAENVIVGEIPQTYYNLEGFEDNSTAMEIME